MCIINNTKTKGLGANYDTYRTANDAHQIGFIDFEFNTHF